jgi:hypothetical protein
MYPSNRWLDYNKCRTEITLHSSYSQKVCHKLPRAPWRRQNNGPFCTLIAACTNLSWHFTSHMPCHYCKARAHCCKPRLSAAIVCQDSNFSANCFKSWSRLGYCSATVFEYPLQSNPPTVVTSAGGAPRHSFYSATAFRTANHVDPSKGAPAIRKHTNALTAPNITRHQT